MTPFLKIIKESAIKIKPASFIWWCPIDPLKFFYLKIYFITLETVFETTLFFYQNDLIPGIKIA